VTPEVTGPLPIGEDRIEDVLARTEPLHPDLRPYYRAKTRLGSTLQHPLVYQVAGVHNALANFNYRAKTERLATAREAGDWRTVVFLHERPWRLDAFVDLAREGVLTDDAAYWRLLGRVWVDAENSWQTRDKWIEALGADRPMREHLMQVDDRARFQDLPDTLTVYRGASQSVNEDGLAWTLNPETAKWFAHRYLRHQPVVLRGTVAKSDVLAHFADRGESEILILDPAQSVTLAQ
jgi:hypothetical protein